MSNVEEDRGHTLRWVTENNAGDLEIVEHQFGHSKDCPVEVEESHDCDGKLAWRGGWHDCAITHLEDYLKEDYFEDFMYEQGEGVHLIEFKYTYRYFPPCYPDYEPDYTFEWEKE